MSEDKVYAIAEEFASADREFAPSVHSGRRLQGGFCDPHTPGARRCQDATGSPSGQPGTGRASQRGAADHAGLVRTTSKGEAATLRDCAMRPCSRGCESHPR